MIRLQPLLIWPVLLAALSVGPGKKRENPTTLVFPTFLHTYGVRKATKLHLFLYVQNRVKVRNPQGIAATRLDSWEDPNNDKDDDELTVYGVNSGENVIIYNTSMTSIGIYGLHERGEKRLKAPHGITAAPWGDVYVADTNNDRIVHFYNPGKQLQYRGALRFEGMRQPVGVALAADSTLFVSDTGGNRLLKVRGDTLHAVLAQSGTAPGQVTAPTGVAATAKTDRWNHWKDAFVVVIDQKGKRLQKFAPDGTFLGAVTAEAFGRPEADLQYLAIDYYSNIWVTDKKYHCIHKFDRNLQYLTSFGRKGKGDKEFIEPRGISIYKRFGQVLIAEKEAAQYYWIGSDILNLTASVDDSGFIDISYFLTEPSFVTLEVFDAHGKLLATPMKNIRRPSGANSEWLDGAGKPIPHFTENGVKKIGGLTWKNFVPLPPGRYRLRFTVQATYSSYKYFNKVEEVWVRWDGGS